MSRGAPVFAAISLNRLTPRTSSRMTSSDHFSPITSSAAAIEQGHDKDGIVWPSEIAPFHVAVVVLDEADDAKVRPGTDALVSALEAKGIEVLEDDRDGKPGVKFKDIDLIGIPHRLVISKRTLESGEVEYKKRGSAEAERWKLDDAAAKMAAVLGGAVPASV